MLDGQPTARQEITTREFVLQRILTLTLQQELTAQTTQKVDSLTKRTDVNCKLAVSLARLRKLDLMTTICSSAA